MKYLVSKFKIHCDNEELLQACRELLADDCGECGYESFEDTEDGINGYIQQDEYNEAVLKDTVNSFPVEGVNITYSTEEIPDQDWNAAWEEEGFEPIIVKGMVTIYDARNTVDTEQFSTPLQIGIHASNAFGTGTHETTRMIVGTLLEMPLEGRRVLDCGCGTGILAITALKCGANAAVGYDIDEWSSENAMHNAKLNGVEDRMEVLLGNVNVLSHVDGIFDVVVANINRNILLADMKHFHDVMAKDGTLILSGFYKTDVPMLLQEAEALGLKETNRKQDGDWCCLILSK
ncbi:MAG: 50S ribosomal protein L11 methyltransferase [Prevotella sp.]|nr:50S ribosomal protein L11 methyltransferase [Candidatus Prevotella equi]